jgi:hypothetical protein
MRTVTYQLPPAMLGGSAPMVHKEQVPAGAFGDLWRCDPCGELWRVGNGCFSCDPAPPTSHCRLGGFHPPGLTWRPATWWQRFRHRKTADVLPIRGGDVD